MLKALNTSATGMQAQQTSMEVVSNNVANASTAGFKKSRAEFEDLLYHTKKAPGAATGLNAVSPTGVQVGLGVKTGAVQRDYSMGGVKQTGNPFDLAIMGKGFFQLANEEGQIMYSRNGEFKRDPEGKLVDKNGNALIPMVKLPSDTVDFRVTNRGEVEISRDRLSKPEVIAQIEIASFINPAGLRSLGNNNFAATRASGNAQKGMPGRGHFGELVQGELEGSNVNIAEEMVNMITTQRSYETNAKVMQAADQMLQMINNLR